MPAIDVRSLVGDMGSAETITRERPNTASGFDSYGDPIITANGEVEIVALVHPPQTDQLQRLGLDMQQSYRHIISESSLLLRDVIQYDGARWEVINAEDHHHVAGLYMALAQRIDA